MEEFFDGDNDFNEVKNVKSEDKQDEGARTLSPDGILCENASQLLESAFASASIDPLLSDFPVIGFTIIKMTDVNLSDDFSTLIAERLLDSCSRCWWTNSAGIINTTITDLLRNNTNVNIFGIAARPIENATIPAFLCSLLQQDTQGESDGQMDLYLCSFVACSSNQLNGNGWDESLQTLTTILDSHFDGKCVCLHMSICKPSDNLSTDSVVVYHDSEMNFLISPATSSLSRQAMLDTERDAKAVSTIHFEEDSVSMDTNSDVVSALQELVNSSSSDKTIFGIIHNQTIYSVAYDEESDSFVCEAISESTLDPVHLNDLHLALCGHNMPECLLDIGSDRVIVMSEEKVVIHDAILRVSEMLKESNDGAEELMILLVDQDGRLEPLSTRQLAEIIRLESKKVDENLEIENVSTLDTNSSLEPSTDSNLFYFNQDAGLESDILDKEIQDIQSRILSCMQRGISHAAIKLSQVPKSEAWMDGEYTDTLRTLYNLENEQLEKSRKSEVVIGRLQRSLKEKEVTADELQQSLSQLVQEISATCVNSRTGKPIPRKELTILESTEALQNENLIRVRLKNIHLQNSASKLQRELRHQAELGDGLSLSSFDQLRMENQAFLEKIKVRAQEMNHIQKKHIANVQLVSHMKQKLQHVRQLSQSSSHVLSQKNDQAEMDRLELVSAVENSDFTKQEVEDLVTKHGIYGIASRVALPATLASTAVLGPIDKIIAKDYSKSQEFKSSLMQDVSVLESTYRNLMHKLE